MINSEIIMVIGPRPVDTSRTFFSSLDSSDAIDDIGKSDIIHSLREFTNEDLSLKYTVTNRHQQLLHNTNNKYNDEIKSIDRQIEEKRKQLTDTENTPEWIFLTTSRQYIYKINLSFTVGSNRINANAEFKNFKDKERLLANNFDDNVKDIIQFDIRNIDEFYRDIKKRTDIYARNKLLEIKAQHAVLTQEIEGYTTKLKHTEIAKSSIVPIGFNFFGSSGDRSLAGVQSYVIYGMKEGKTVEELDAGVRALLKGTHPEGQDPARGLLVAWGNFMGIPLDVYWSNEEMTPEKAAQILSGSIPTSGAKLIQYLAAKSYVAVVKSGKPLPEWNTGTGQYSFKDTKPNSEMAGSIRNVNPGYPESGRIHNCVSCAIATDSTLSGHPATALSNATNKGIPLSVLEKQYGAKFVNISTTDNISQQMINAGSGARGIVYGSYGQGQVGHVFNVVNQKGVIRYLDGQTGKPADLSQFKSFQLLRTN